MAKKEDKLTSEEKDIAIAWLRPRMTASGGACEVCGTTHWLVGDYLVAPVNFISSKDNLSGLSLGGDVSPQFTITCKECGNTKYFNAIVAGIFSIEGEKDVE